MPEPCTRVSCVQGSGVLGRLHDPTGVAGPPGTQRSGTPVRPDI